MNKPDTETTNVSPLTPIDLLDGAVDENAERETDDWRCSNCGHLNHIKGLCKYRNPKNFFETCSCGSCF